MFCLCQSIARVIVICIYRYLTNYSIGLSEYKTYFVDYLRIIIFVFVHVELE